MNFLRFVDQQVPAEAERIYAIMDNLDMHHCHDLLLFMLTHERGSSSISPPILST